VKHQNAQAEARTITDKIMLTSTEIERALNAFEDVISQVNVSSAIGTPKSNIDRPDSFDTIKNMSNNPLCPEVNPI
jgi:hypothetical protein